MKNVFKIIIVVSFFVILAGIIAYARGYRIDFKKKSLLPTGILAISSSPKAAKVFINGELKGATDINLTLIPGRYSVEIKKEGYLTWSRSFNLKGELVLPVEALLFPNNPSLSPLTSLGIVKAFPLDQTGKVIIFADNNDITKDGIYFFDVSKKISLFPPLKQIILKQDLGLNPDINFGEAEVYFSPDYKQMIADWGKNAYLLSIDDENAPLDVSYSKKVVVDAWEKEKEIEKLKIFETFPKDMVKIATESFKIISFSPDETKVLYQARLPVELTPVLSPPMIAANQTQEERTLKKDAFYVYDKKEDKNFRIYDQVDDSMLWFPDSKHLIFKENKKIALTDYSGENKQTVYSGPFESSFFTTTSDGKIVVLINLNPDINKQPDLYLVGIR